MKATTVLQLLTRDVQISTFIEQIIVGPVQSFLEALLGASVTITIPICLGALSGSWKTYVASLLICSITTPYGTFTFVNKMFRISKVIK